MANDLLGRSFLLIFLPDPSRPNITKGDRILLVYPPSLDFILAFIACLKAGLIAVPVFPPDPRRLDKGLLMFNSVVSSCGARCALTSVDYNYASKIASLKVMKLSPSLLTSFQSFLFINSSIQWPDLDWIITDNLIKQGKQLNKISDIWLSQSIQGLESQTPAFLQYTSGSTSGKTNEDKLPSYSEIRAQRCHHHCGKS